MARRKKRFTRWTVELFNQLLTYGLPKDDQGRLTRYTPQAKLENAHRPGGAPDAVKASQMANAKRRHRKKMRLQRMHRPAEFRAAREEFPKTPPSVLRRFWYGQRMELLHERRAARKQALA